VAAIPRYTSSKTVGTSGYAAGHHENEWGQKSVHGTDVDVLVVVRSE
jgi:hypothetical protein